MRTLWVATTSAGKLRELRALLGERDIEVRDLSAVPGFEVVEDGATFEANALKKAEALVRRLGEPALADDSGLVVDALDGAPGVYSARFAGVAGVDRDVANRRMLLRELEAVPDGARGARFVCVLAYAVPGQASRLFRGRWEGAIARHERGDGGFGYDSVFVPTGEARTAAELEADEKNRLGHRGQALREFVRYIEGAAGWPAAGRR